MRLGLKKNKLFSKIGSRAILNNYYKKYIKFSFIDLNCFSQEQFEASITRLYHTIEKGLSYIDYHPGFGQENVNNLLISMEQYAQKYDTSRFFFRSAISTLNEYIQKNKDYGYEDKSLEDRVAALPGKTNECGGIIEFNVSEAVKYNYEEMVKNRHSIRHFSEQPLDIEKVKEAIALAQYTPSACNRQGWKCYIIQDKKKIEELLFYQNGNKGFGQEFDKLILVAGDLRAFNRNREVFQAFIDGGMYAMRVLDSLYYKGIAACPLSASLTIAQETNARKIIGMDDAEVFILYIGIGNYPEKCQTAKSERHSPNFIIC